MKEMTAEQRFYEKKRKEMPVYIIKAKAGYVTQIPEMGRTEYSKYEDAEDCLKRFGYTDIQLRKFDGQL